VTQEAEIILFELRKEMARQASPWAGRESAAEYCDCSASKIDRAANRGDIKRYKNNGSPVFKKKELDAWIERGKKP